MKTSRTAPALLAAALLLAPSLHAQSGRRQRGGPVALPKPVESTQPSAPPADAALPTAGETPAAAPQPAPIPKEPPVPVKGGVLLNFQGAALTDVLNYLSEAAGFIIVQEAQVTGTVNVMSKQPVSPDDAVDLLNAVLIEKGYTTIRNGRILKIVSRKDAQKRDLPVMSGSDPDKILRKDEMVTQILPLRFGEAGKLMENLKPLLAENATISANEASNSLIMTDTQTNIRRVAQIIRALDTSVASISTIRIFPLKYADAKELSTVITQLFAPASSSSQGGGRGGRGGGFFGGFGPGGPGGGGQPQSEVKQAETHVVATADETSNSLIVSAPDELMPTISEMVTKLDTTVTDVSDTRIFRLQHADAVELAAIITTLYSDTGTQKNRNTANDQGGGGGRGFGFFGQQPQQPASTQQSSRALQQTKVVAVGDPRTNSLLITASRDTMMQVAEMIGRLDATDAKKQRVYVYSLEHADVDNVANVLRGMLGDQTAITNSTQTAASRLTNRSANGATMDTSEFSTSNTGRGGGGGGR